MSFYSGDRSTQPDLLTVAAMAQQFAAAGAPAGYALDVGVLQMSGTTQTALVEVNEGFAVGAYEDVLADVYAGMLVAYWFELARA